jgi:two-component system, NarL family, nitrate/nitrite response regulator NarL
LGANMHEGKIRVAIVDDHQIVVDGILSLLSSNSNIVVTAHSNSPKEILQTLQLHPVDVLITDIYMPEMNGMDLAKNVRSLFPSVKILVLSMSGQGSIVNAMINEADISGYVLKNISKEELSAAIGKIHCGGIYFSEEALAELGNFNTLKEESEKVNLTQREVEIVQLIEKELSNKEIADRLFISERTVETHRKNIFRKTGTSSLIGLIKYAYQHQVINPGSAGRAHDKI